MEKTRATWLIVERMPVNAATVEAAIKESFTRGNIAAK